MTLNLSIISGDLGGLCLEKAEKDPLRRRLRFPVIYNGEHCPKDDRLYIVKARDMSENLDLGAHPSFLFIGKPSAGYLSGFCDMAVLDDKNNIADVLSLTLEIFDRYNKWEADLQNAIIQNQSYKTLGIISEPVFENPIVFIDRNYKCIFSIVNASRYKIPDNLIFPDDNTYTDIEFISRLRATPNYFAITKKRTPWLFDNAHWYKQLYQNIFIADKRVGCLFVCEINRKFTDRDFALITFLADALIKMMPNTESSSLSRSKYLEDILKNLTKHKPVNSEQLDTALAEMNWNVNDTYFCVTMESETNEQNYSSMTALALRISALMSSECYLIQKNSVFFVFNLTADKTDKTYLVKTIVFALKNSAVKTGVSNLFSDFNDVYYYYRQTLSALEQGRKKAPGSKCYYFDDYILDAIIQKSYRDTIPEALYPEGFLRILRYDNLKGTNYVDTLKAFLESNMNIAETIKKVYMHRNTFLYRIDKIKEILGMDLDNADTRLLLRIIMKQPRG
jgi:sugar diacid utilization regulator